MSRPLFVAGLALLLSALTARSASPTTVIAPTFEELATRATRILVAEVIRTDAHWINSSQGRGIVTTVTLRIEEQWKGSAQILTQLEFLGGTIGELTLEVADFPAFAVGDRDILFVRDGGNYVSPLVAMMYGRLRLARDGGRDDLVRMFDGRSLTTLSSLGKSAADTPSPAGSALRLADVRTAVRAVLSRAR